MMQSIVSTLDTKEAAAVLDYDNLNIITHPPPPRRRQSGISLIPFRPYVKCLTSVRQPFSFANGVDPWTVIGTDEIFFSQPNTRCIGSLLSDCHISDVIRWDIEGESTRLPMMCKLWMIVDGAVVERGKPHLVQDAAIQVLITGRNLRTMRGGGQQQQHRSDQILFDRHRRQSWHELNEYHSVPYHQYTRPTRTEFQEGTQCDLDNEYFMSREEILPSTGEQIMYDDRIEEFKRHNARITIHHFSIPEEHVHISITTQTEAPFTDRSTTTDGQFIRMFNLNLETNEILLSSIVNPYFRALAVDHVSDVITFHHGREYQHRSVSTGDDYPHWWLRLTTDLLLADFITDQGEEKEKSLPPPSPPRHDQSIQTDIDKSRPSSSSTTTMNHYEFIDDHTRRILPFAENSQRIESRSSDYQNETSSVRSHSHAVRQPRSSETDYNLFVSLLHQQQSSTPDSHSHRTGHPCSSNDTTQIRTKNSDSTSTSILASLLERYERSLRERQHAFTIINDELLDIDDVLKHYRSKLQHSERSNTVMHRHRDISLLSTEDRLLTNITRDKYRRMPEITPDEMIHGYIPSPRLLCLTNSTLVSPRERTPRFVIPSREIIRPDYCRLCLTDYNSSSPWIEYNERRIEQLQKRIDLMLQIDDNEETQLLLLSSSPSSIYSTTPTVSQRIDDILLTRPRYRSTLLSRPDPLLSPSRYQYRLNQSLPTTPRQLSRNTTPVSKSVRISTRSVPPMNRARQTSSSSTSRPIVSILRRTSVPSTPRLSDAPHVWRSKVDGQMYSLKQFSIPRYYRLYHDASFRDMYNFSRILDTYMTPNRSTRDYSSLLTNYALDQHLSSSSITSAA